MPEDRVNIVDTLRGQQEQLKRLIAQKLWISDAPKTILAEIKGQLGELKRLVGQLEFDIRDELKKRIEPRPTKQRSPNAVTKARDLADHEIDRLSDQSATFEQREQRKQRLLKGPPEFRDIREVSRKPKS